jgi:AraC-like DNA-binding protein
MAAAAAPELEDGTIAESVGHVPSGMLRPYVSRIAGYHYAGFEAAVHKGLPSRNVTFVIAFDDPLVIGGLPNGEPGLHSFDICVGGFHTTPVDIHHDGNQHGMHLDVTPAGARALFGMPAAELAWATVRLDVLWGSRAAELHERLATAPDWPARFAVVEHVLSQVIAERSVPVEISADLRMAWARLAGSGGGIEVARLAADTGWSRRHFTQRFGTEFGIGPKAMARVMRFERSRALLLAPPAQRLRLVEIAATCGYADQAHMTRDWQGLAGSSPTAWMASEALPIVQDQKVLGA